MKGLACLALLTALSGAGCWGASAFGDGPARRPTRDAGIDQGTVRSSAEASPAPPQLPRSDRLSCRVDTDCALVERPCTCAPCSDTWREVLNRRELEKLKGMWARRRCRQPICTACAGRWLGTKAVCIKNQCAVR
jgi:hypothetical protein